MSDAGWVKLYRQMTEWEWYSDMPTRSVYIHLLLKANFTDGRFRGIAVPRGSLVTSRNKLATEINLSERQVRTALKHLEKSGEVTIKSYAKFSVITLVNYNKFQGSDQQVTSNRPASDQQVTSNRPQYKKERKEERKNSPHAPGSEPLDYGYVPPDRRF